jgi:hypothetical protein
MKGLATVSKLLVTASALRTAVAAARALICGVGLVVTVSCDMISAGEGPPSHGNSSHASSQLGNDFRQEPLISHCARHAEQIRNAHGYLYASIEGDKLFSPLASSENPSEFRMAKGNRTLGEALNAALPAQNIRRSVEISGWVIRKLSCPELTTDVYFVKQLKFVTESVGRE